MIRSTVSVLLALSLVGIVLSSAVPASEELNNLEEPTYAVQMYTDVVSNQVAGEDSAVDFVTPYGYKAVMVQSSGRKVPCWRCGSPCSHGFCCDDGYPQCCLVNGNCRCCRR